MVYNIITQHKGFIDIYSEVGIGTKFELNFPEHVSAEKLQKSMQKEVKIHKGEGTILVIDDEKLMRDIAGSILSKCGYNIIFAENGQVGIDVFKKHQKEVKAVLLDMNMPVKSGLDTFQELREIDSNIKIIMSSGFEKDERMQKVIDLGVNDFIQKPYTIKNLSLCVYRIIYGKE